MSQFLGNVLLGGGICSPPAAAPANGLLTGLVSFWKLDEASGDALDVHGGKTLTHTNDPGADTGKLYSTARVFAPANTEYFSRSDAALRGGADFTVAAWVYVTSLELTPNYHKIADCVGWGGGWAMGEHGNPATQEINAFLQLSAGGGAYPTQHITAVTGAWSQWHLLIGWYNATTRTLRLSYNNGNEQAPVVAAADCVAGGNTLRVGCNMAANNDYWDGLIGPLMYWSKCLSDAERTALYNGGAGLPYTAFTE